MSTIIMRSALVAWGRKDIPPDLHSIVDDPWRGRHIVTWGEFMQRRREDQARILASKRHFNPWRAYKLWVAYFDQFLFGGWHAFLENGAGSTWITPARCGRPIPHLMALFPLVLGGDDRFEQWKIEFAGAYRRRTQHRKPLGVRYVWWNGSDAPRLTAHVS